MEQYTLEREVHARGIGLHGGQRVGVRLLPAAVDHGWVFVRVDLPGSPLVPIEQANACETTLCTGIEHNGIKVRTIEHLMASLLAMGVDNLRIELDAEEVPIFDGSAAPWIHLLREAGLKKQNKGEQAFRLEVPVEITLGDGWSKLSPADHFTAAITIDFDHPAIEAQRAVAQWSGDPKQFADEISRARTFGFMDQVEAMSENGLARGGSLANAVVYGGFQVVNHEGLRVADEAAQHKLLDAIGDVAVLGRGVLAHLETYRPGHTINQALVAKARQSGHLVPVRWTPEGWMEQAA